MRSLAMSWTCTLAFLINRTSLSPITSCGRFAAKGGCPVLQTPAVIPVTETAAQRAMFDRLGAVRSDRGLRVKPFRMDWQEALPYCSVRCSPRFKSRLMRGISPVSGRDLFDRTGLFFDTFPCPSRKTI